MMERKTGKSFKQSNEKKKYLRNRKGVEFQKTAQYWWGGLYKKELDLSKIEISSPILGERLLINNFMPVLRDNK